jgi:G protein beta subunit-like protein
MRSQSSRNNYVGGQGHHRYGNNSEQAQHQPSQDAHSVILVTAGYDHVIRFWEALSGVSSRTIQFPDSVI